MLQYFVDGVWKDIASGASIGANKSHHFKAVTTSKCRLFIPNAKQKPMITEFKIYNR
ncbi:hypothetical protein JCM19302_2029 [Jejuia pallidilutea]|uniref:Uncharacterized protein n=3 Tax=Jejuia pallidilutea TaxID=504487 RepID=A0A090W1Q6_9FLAO|nr:hypothetical protein JCM19302_2029 [Jejuia pallidilutea]